MLLFVQTFHFSCVIIWKYSLDANAIFILFNNVVTTVSAYTSATGDTPVVYTGQVSGQVSRAALVALPTVHSTTGMLKITFISDNTLALSGFAFRFFALHTFRGIVKPVLSDHPFR